VREGEEGQVRALALTCLALTILVLSGCGGGGETESATTAQAPQGTSTDSAGEAKAQKGFEEKAPSRAHQRQIKNPPIASTRTPGQKAVAPGVPTAKGSDNSIQVFGVEGGEDDASKATRALSAYLAAIGAGQWDRACQEASAQLKEQLTQLIEQAKAKGGAKIPEGCAEILELLLGGAKGAASFATQASRKVLSFRAEDPYAYLIYEDAKGAIRFIAMANDEGTWKVNVPQPTELQTTTGGTDESQQ
jgi:hypothetical protein